MDIEEDYFDEEIDCIDEEINEWLGRRRGVGVGDRAKDALCRGS